MRKDIGFAIACSIFVYFCALPADNKDQKGAFSVSSLWTFLSYKTSPQSCYERKIIRPFL